MLTDICNICNNTITPGSIVVKFVKSYIKDNDGNWRDVPGHVCSHCSLNFPIPKCHWCDHYVDVNDLYLLLDYEILSSWNKVVKDLRFRIPSLLELTLLKVEDPILPELREKKKIVERIHGEINKVAYMKLICAKCIDEL